MEESYKNEILDNPSPTNKFAYPTIKDAFVLFLILILCQILAGIPTLIIERTTTWPTPPFNLLSLVFSFIGVLLFVQLKRGKESYSFKMVPFISIPLFCLMAISIPVILEPMVSWLPMPDWVTQLFEELIQKNIYSFLAVVVVAPIFEEMIFRGVLLKGFLKNYSPTKAILWSALFFGIAHLNPWQFITAFFAGCLFGWVYWRTRSLIPCILLHMVNNGLAFGAMFYVEDMETTFRTLIGNDFYYLVLYVGCLGVFLGCFFALRRIFPIPNAEPV